MPPGSRRSSRIVAFQSLFEADLSGRPLAEVLSLRLADAKLQAEAEAFARDLAEGVQERRPEIDPIIEQRAPAFPLEEMAAVDRNVLRLAIYELLFDNRRAPVRVVINEAVELAKGYGSESSGRFVNGVLAAVAVAASSD